MNNSSFYPLIGAAALALALSSAAALALAIGDVNALAPDAAAASVPAALSVLVWGPIVALSFVCCLGLFWLLRDPASEPQVEASVQPLPARTPHAARRLPARAQRRPLRAFPRRAATPV